PRPAAPADGPGPGPDPGGTAAAGDAEEETGGTVLFRRPDAGRPATPGPAAGTGRPPTPTPGPASAPASAAGTAAGTDDDPGTMKFRAVSPRAAQRPTGSRPGTPGTPAAHQGPAVAPQPFPTQQPQPQPPAPSGPQLSPGAVPPQAPLTAGPGGGQSSWAQQVHRLAGAGAEEQPVAPWRPPTEDIFQAAARRQAAARPAGLGKRLAARLLDTVVLAAVTAVPGVPLGMKAADHIADKIDAAKLSGETVTVWLLDGTTSVYLGIVLAVLLVFGVGYEALPTAKWGRTLGKKLCGLEVRDIEAHEPPSFGAALRRWLVYSVPGLLVIGIVGVLWCLFDRPWRQCWHDKAAGTFVAG
ncbi:RDD family protein, partial [Streptomyces sp. JW3]|uniref:RDD family protein n=1 Tax=Streptomyces sp. JW3 TaxID=3456955 RepID=UPI003FA4B19C